MNSAINAEVLKILHGVLAHYNGTKRFVEEYITNNRTLMTSYSQIKGDEVADFLLEHGVGGDVIDVVRQILSVPSIFNDLTLKRLESMIKTASPIFVKPRERILDFYTTFGRKNGKWRRINRKVVFHYFSIRETILAVLSHNETFQEIISEQPSSDQMIRKDLDGEMLKADPNLLPTIENDTVTLTIRLLLFTDEFENANPLGSKTKIHKVNGFYFKIMNVCDTNSLSNVFVYALARANIVKKYGYDAVLEPFVDEVLQLMSGITVKLHGMKVVLKVKFVGVTGDTLGLHEILLLLSPSTTRFCRDCLITRGEFHRHPYRLGIRRTETNRATLARRAKRFPRLNLMRRDGYRSTRDTILKKLGFNPRQNKKFDKLHDLFEGVTMLLIIAILRFCFKEKIFTSDFFNERLKAFDYGQVNESNKPSPNISENDIKNEKSTRLKQNAAQVHLLLRVLPFIIRDKVEDFYLTTDEERRGVCRNWMRLLTIHLQVVKLISSRVMSSGQISDMEQAIRSHNLLWSEIKNSTNPELKQINKLHHLLHYSSMVRLWGPAYLYETSMFEGEHRLLKSRMNNTNNFVNITKTLADTVAFVLSYRFSYPVSKEVFNKMGSRIRFNPNNEPSFHGTNMKYEGIHYQCGQILCIQKICSETNADALPVFACIEHMVYTHEELTFHLTLLESIYYHDEYCAYVVEKTTTKVAVTWASIPCKYPMALWRNCTNTIQHEMMFVSVKTAEI